MGWTDPSAHVYASGEHLSSATLNTYVEANLVWLGTPPGARAYRAAALSPANNTATAVVLDTTRYDTDSIHPSSSSRMTFTHAGKYLITVCVDWASNATGDRKIYLQLNGATIIDQVAGGAAASGLCTQKLSTVYSFAAADYVELFVLQTSGGGLAVNMSGNFSPEVAVAWQGF